ARARRPEGAGAGAGVAGVSGRRDAQEHCIAIAIGARRADLLRIAARRALHPELIARSTPGGRSARRKRAFHGLAGLPREHEHLAGGRVLDDAGNETALVVGQLVGPDHATSSSGQRMGNPRRTHSSFTSATDRDPKWNTVA